MNTSQATTATRIKVGVFTLLGLLAVGGITVYVNHKPFWWRPCQLVQISVEDASGLKMKSPIKSLGIEIGYLHSVELAETHVSLGICITAPVEVLPNTKAYLRSDGFLGDKYVELKPVKYVGPIEEKRATWSLISPAHAETSDERDPAMATKAKAEPPATKVAPRRSGSREIPVGEEGQDVQHLVRRIDELVHQVSGLANNLQTAINPEELKKTMHELNRTLESASKTLSPEGGLNQTAQRSLAKLEDAIEQLRDLMTRVNKGEGSVGMLLNDPSYAEELREAIKNVNRLLGRVGNVRFAVDIGADYLMGYAGGRGHFELSIYPSKDRYYLVGVSIDPRGKLVTTTTVTTAGGLPPTTTQTRQTDPNGLLITAQFGKIFWSRVNLAIGVLYGDGVFSATLNLGPHDREEMLQIKSDAYVQNNSASSLNDRLLLTIRPWWTTWIRAGIEGFTPVNGVMPWMAGAGIAFDDEDIKLLFALK